MSSGALSPGNLFGSFGVHNTISSGTPAPAAPVVPAALATPPTPLPPAVIPTADPTSAANIAANQRAVAQAVNANGRSSTILTSFAARPTAGSGSTSSGTSDYSKKTLAAG